MKLVFGKDEAVTRWVASRIPFVGDRGFGQCTAIGIVGKDGQELAGIVWHDWQPQFRTIAFSIASTTPRWATHNILRLLLMYPFVDCGVWKVWTATPSTNERALRVVAGYGFKKEATLAHHFGMGTHAIINRMYQSDYERIYRSKRSGKAVSTQAA